jgi:thiol peroxidase
MQVFFKGSPLQTIGQLPTIGALAPNFTLTKTDLSNITLKEFSEKKEHVILNIFISIDTAVCAISVRKFNEAASNFNNTTVLCVSQDLPFAHKRFCATEKLERVIPVSSFRNPEFGKDYGVTITNGPLKNLLARAIIIIAPNQKVIYTEQVFELTHEPDYATALKALVENKKY